MVFDCKAMPEIDFTIVQVTWCMCACDCVTSITFDKCTNVGIEKDMQGLAAL